VSRQHRALRKPARFLGGDSVADFVRRVADLRRQNSLALGDFRILSAAVYPVLALSRAAAVLSILLPRRGPTFWLQNSSILSLMVGESAVKYRRSGVHGTTKLSSFLCARHVGTKCRKDSRGDAEARSQRWPIAKKLFRVFKEQRCLANRQSATAFAFHPSTSAGTNSTRKAVSRFSVERGAGSAE
jgi:hypothetical protein